MDSKPHAELPKLQISSKDKLAAQVQFNGMGDTAFAEREHAARLCRERQLLAALQSIAALTARAEKAEAELEDLCMEVKERDFND